MKHSREDDEALIDLTHRGSVLRLPGYDRIDVECGPSPNRKGSSRKNGVLERLPSFCPDPVHEDEPLRRRRRVVETDLGAVEGSVPPEDEGRDVRNDHTTRGLGGRRGTQEE